MSFAEKNTWLWAVIGVVVPGVYIVSILSQLQTTAAAQIAYQQPMLISIGVVIVLSILAAVVAATISGGDVKEDLRDKEIYRFGEYAGYWLMMIGAVTAMGMAMAKVDHFWIANTIYVAGVLAGLVGSVVKIASYRLGLQSW
jgi:hypothetical protein